MDAYTYSTNVYSPEGRIYQLEYANKAIKNSSTVFSYKTKNSIFLFSEKKLYSKLLISSFNSIFQVSKNIVGVSTGIIPDCEYLIEKIRKKSSDHFFDYNSQIDIKTLAFFISRNFFSLNGEKHLKLNNKENDFKRGRPFASQIILCSYSDENKLEMISIDVFGSITECERSCAGAASELVEEIFDKKENMELIDGVKILNQLMEKKLNGKNFNICEINENGIFHFDTEKKMGIFEEMLKDENEKYLHDGKSK